MVNVALRRGIKSNMSASVAQLHPTPRAYSPVRAKRPAVTREKTGADGDKGAEDEARRRSAELVARAQDGDSAAFRELFRAHRQDVARLVYRMTGSQSDLEDLVQDVFLQVHRSIGKFRGQSRFSTWLYRITVNVVLMHRRALGSRPKYAEEDAASAPADIRPLPDAQTQSRQRVRAFYSLLERLSEKKREVYVLHELQGVSPKDIAEIVDAPVLTVRTRLFYARKELAELLRDEPNLAALADLAGKKPRRKAKSAEGSQ